MPSTSSSSTSPTLYPCSLCPKSFATKRGLTRHLNTHDRNPFLQFSHLVDAVGPEGNFRCPLCHSVFTSKIGLSQHQRRTHPAEYNETKLQRLPTSKYFWSSLDDAALIQLANELSSVHPMQKDLYSAVAAHFPNRSDEAIKRRLNLLQWTRPPLSLPNSPPAVTPTPSNHTPAIFTPQPHLDPEGAMEPSPPPTLSPRVIVNDSWKVDLLSSALQQLASASQQQGAEGKDPYNIRSLQPLCQALTFSDCSVEEARNSINTFCQNAFPHIQSSNRPRPSSNPAHHKRAQLRRLQYAHIQKLYRTRLKDAASTVLDGRWTTAYMETHSSIPNFYEYWSSIFSSSTHHDARPIRSVSSQHFNLISPVTHLEVSQALKELNGKAPGVDHVRAIDLKSVDPSLLAGFFNLLLLCEFVPPHLSVARITFVPKVDLPAKPDDFRPISVESLLLRVFHKILFLRWSPHFPHDKAQFGFLQRDGTFEATTVLHSLLRHSHTHSRNLSFASIDISKAFDSISHDSLLRGAQAFGAPAPLLNYLRSFYQNSVSTFNFQSVHPQRGVRQGDPLSPLLFIMAMDEALESCASSGYSVDDFEIHHLAYADDVILFAPSFSDLKTKILIFEDLISHNGLSLNSMKSFYVNIRADRHLKSTVLDTSSFLPNIRSLGPCDSFKYLGLQFNWKGKLPTTAPSELINMLDNLSRAPLKPHQRMHLLRFFLIPRLTHSLSMAVVHLKTLKSMDLLVRSSVRKWLRLPKDVPISFFHADISDGGLGIPHLQTSVLLNRRNRLARLLQSPIPMLHWAAREPSAASIQKLASHPIRIQQTIVLDKPSAKEAWANSLYQSLDGAGLQTSSSSPASHLWLRFPERVFPRLYIRAIQMRAACLSTKVRRNRGLTRKSNDVRCRGRCGDPESLSHIINNCQLTHDIRCKRHNATVQLIANKLRRRNINFMCEPHIPLPTSFCKPDIILTKDNTAYVLDFSISNPTNAQQAYEFKRSKYGSPACVSRTKSFLHSLNLLPNNVKQIPIIVSFRGIMFSRSERHLLSLGFSKTDISDICLSAISGCVKTYDCYMRGTSLH